MLSGNFIHDSKGKISTPYYVFSNSLKRLQCVGRAPSSSTESRSDNYGKGR